ncbi:MAG: universal stress protein [Proteobacteria bacterium]|nr:universal stress protein [Pseudomonadota bacterium]
MSQPPQLPFVHSVFHASDFSAASESAFAHALAVALVRQTRLTLLHVAEDDFSDEWQRFPAVRETLERWGLLQPGSPRAAVFGELAVRVKKVALRGSRPASRMLEYLEEHPSDLVVLASEGRDGIPRWLRESVAERLARRAQTLALIVPQRARGFVSLEDGQLSLRRVLVPADHTPPAGAAVALATRAARALGDGTVDLTLLHVGEPGSVPELELPEGSPWRWNRVERGGDPVEGILKAAGELAADLIVMTTDGRQGLLDVLRGSHSERVLRRADCPILCVPQAWVDAVGD